MIQITGNIYLDSSDQCYIVCEWDGKVDKKGRRITTNAKYYANLDTLFKGVLNRMTRRDIQEADTMEELCVKINEGRELVSNILSSVLSFGVT